jgi:hypothetical protein
MPNWLPLALLTALCLALYNFFIKLAANHVARQLWARWCCNWSPLP